MSYRIHAASSAAYNVLLGEDVLCLPSKSTLKRVTKRLDTHTCLSNLAYLKLRILKLNQFERNVVLMIDEIYIAKRVEYSGGEVQGLTADGSVASTLLCHNSCTLHQLFLMKTRCMSCSALESGII
jgi:hypothetical protein